MVIMELIAHGVGCDVPFMIKRLTTSYAVPMIIIIMIQIVKIMITLPHENIHNNDNDPNDNGVNKLKKKKNNKCETFGYVWNI